MFLLYFAIRCNRAITAFSQKPYPLGEHQNLKPAYDHRAYRLALIDNSRTKYSQRMAPTALFKPFLFSIAPILTLTGAVESDLLATILALTPETPGTPETPQAPPNHRASNPLTGRSQPPFMITATILRIPFIQSKHFGSTLRRSRPCHPPTYHTLGALSCSLSTRLNIRKELTLITLAKAY